MSNHEWNTNTPSDSSWTNNATESTLNVSAYKVGSSNVQGTKLNNDKRLYFGTNSQFSMRYNSATEELKFAYTDPSVRDTRTAMTIKSNGDVTISNLITTTQYEYEVINADGILFNEVDNFWWSGEPDMLATQGKMVYTRQTGALYRSSIWVALLDNPPAP